MTFLHKWCWVLSNLRCAPAIFITIFYWAVLFDSDEDRVDYSNVFTHILNSVICLVDVIVSARPWRWQHFYQPAILALV